MCLVVKLEQSQDVSILSLSHLIFLWLWGPGHEHRVPCVAQKIINSHLILQLGSLYFKVPHLILAQKILENQILEFLLQLKIE